MNEFVKKYLDLDSQIKSIGEELEKLESNSKVQQYLELRSKKQRLTEKRSKVYIDMKNYEYSSCEHVLVSSKVKNDLRGRTYKICGCIKCGLNEEVISKKNLSFKESVMFEYLKKNGLYIKGKRISLDCDLSLGRAIYRKIYENNKDIDTDTLIKYFERSLAHIRKHKVSEERKANRAKRLLLKPNFNKWDAIDVVDERGRL